MSDPSTPSAGGPPSRYTRPVRRPLSTGKKLSFALLCGLLFIGLTELALRITGVPGAPDRTTTWFADHILRPPLWSPRELADLETRFMAAGQAHHFHPFPVNKADDSFRIAVFGGSAAHGYGVLEPGAFPHRLEQLLQKAVPEKEIQVINLGTVAWSSQQILWANRRLYELPDWDLIILYAGHNELLELSSWKSYKTPSEHRRYTRTLLLNQRLEGLRLHQLLRSLLGNTEPPLVTGRPEQPQPADRTSELQPGLDPVAITPAMRLDNMKAVPREKRARIGRLERTYAARTFKHNIGKLIDLARRRDIPVVLMNPAPNDFHDPVSFPRDGEDGAHFNRLMERGEEIGLHDFVEGERIAREGLESYEDPRAMFLLAQSLGSQGKVEEARHWYIQARRWSEYPNRVVPEVSEAILSLGNRRGVLGAIDIEAMFRARAENGLIEYDLVYDHCHPSVGANWLIAGTLTKFLLEADIDGLDPPGEPPIDAWVEAGRASLGSRTTEDPRLWEWTGRDFSGENPQYIADFQGDWHKIIQRHKEAITSYEVSAMDWVWAGNSRFYDYRAAEALVAWNRALELDPQLCIAWANKAYALRLLGARPAALEAAEQAVRCAPDLADYRAERDLLRRLKR